MSIIFTKPSVAQSSSNVSNRTLFQVPANSNQIIGSVPINITQSVKWWITVTDPNTGKIFSYNITAINMVTDTRHVISNIVGDTFAHNCDVYIMGGTHMVLEITNNIANTIDIRIKQDNNISI